jgi:hypothetical protein
MNEAAPALTITLPDGTMVTNAEAAVTYVETALARSVFPESPGCWVGREGEAGWALIQLFGRMVELIFARLNQVPDNNFLAFLNSAGVSLLPPRPARSEITFVPQKDAPPFIRVPAGTQVATIQTEAQGEVVFETQQNMLVVPVKLIRCVSLDPVGVSDNTDHANSESPLPGPSFAAFQGETERRRILYLGDRDLFGFSDAGSRTSATIILSFRFATPGDAEADGGWLLTWLYWDGARWADLSGVGCKVDDGTNCFSRNGEVTLTALPEIMETEVSGEKNIWLACRLAGGNDRAHLPMLRQVLGSRSISITSSQTAVVDQAFSAIQANTAFVPLDLASEFFPLGPVPGYLDTLYVRCNEAFSKAGATVQLTMANLIGVPAEVSSTELTELTVVWEYSSTQGWGELGRSKRSGVIATTSGFEDTTRGFTVGTSPKGGSLVSFTMPDDSAEATVNEIKGYWVRARVAAGGYGVPASVVITDKTTGSYTFIPGRTYVPFIRRVVVSYSKFDSTLGQRKILQGWSQVDEMFRSHSMELAEEIAFAPFTAAAEGPALYLGFQPAFPAEKWIQLLLDVVEEGETTSATDVAWEYWNGTSWVGLRASDGTHGLRRREYLGFFGPADHHQSTEFGTKAFFFRARPVPEADGMAGLAGLSSSAVITERSVFMPCLRAVRLNTAPALNAVTVKEEILGSSTGKPAQTFKLRRTPVLPEGEIAVREPDRPPAKELDLLDRELRQHDPEAQAVSTVSTATEGVWVRWHQVEDFLDSSPYSRHFSVDPISGEVQFGNGRQGKIPPTGQDNIKARRYRTHDGPRGNLKSGSITTIRNPGGEVANIKSARNIEAAAGGSPAEEVREVRERGPQILRHRQRAVTWEDFVWLAREATGEVAQARCLATRNHFGLPEPGWVTVVIMPNSTDKKPEPSPALVREVRSYMEERALVNLMEARHIHVKGPEYIEATVFAQVVARAPEMADEVELGILDRLESFLHPLKGGPEGKGWELGRNVFLSEIYAEIEAVEGVDHVCELSLVGSMQVFRLDLSAEPVVGYRLVPFRVLAGSEVSTFDDRIRLLLAEELEEKEALRSVVVSGFKVGDIVDVVATDGSVVKANLAITSLANGVVGFGESFLLRDDAETLRSTDGRLCLPLVPPASVNSLVATVIVQSLAVGDKVSILTRGERHPNLEFLPIAVVEPCRDRIHVPEGHLVYSGSHDIDMVLE